MSMTVGDFLVQRLKEWGVQRVYGYPGDGINGILAGLQRASNQPTFIQARHEEMAAFMACAHAKFTGEVGVCLATSGPGAIHLLNGLYDAKLDHQPVVAIVGQQQQQAIGGAYQQEVDLLSLFKDVAHEFVHMLTEPAQARHLVDRAFRVALSERAITCIIVPNDVQEMDAVPEPPHEHGTVHTGVGYRAPRMVPSQDELRQAADVLNAGQRVAILVGAGAREATDQVIQAAELLGAGVGKALLGDDVVPDDLPFVTGNLGLIGAEPSWNLMMECDTLLMIGSSFPYSEFLPKEGQARGVQIDIQGSMLSLRYPMEVNLVGDSAATLEALIPHLERKTDRAWRERIETSVRSWWEKVRENAHQEANPINPHRVFWELSQQLPDNSILTGDSGSVVSWLSQNITFRRGMRWSVSGGLATMGSAVPYAIAAKFAYPDRPVIALAGDGAMQMNGNAELMTIVKYWHEWRDPRLVVMVLNNGDLSFVTWEQRMLMGNPRFDASQALPSFPYARYAELIGLRGRRVERSEDIAAAWEEALSSDLPFVLEVVTDPDVPPMPLSHVTPKQAEGLATAREKGDGGIVSGGPDALKRKMEAFLPEGV